MWLKSEVALVSLYYDCSIKIFRMFRFDPNIIPVTPETLLLIFPAIDSKKRGVKENREKTD